MYLCTKKFFNYHIVMLKAKMRYILPVLGLNKSFKNVGKNLKTCKSIFDITITYSDIPCKRHMLLKSKF
jgi:hypothetical protein